MSADVVSEDPRRMLRIKDASRLLDIPESTLRRLCALGHVPAVKVGHVWRVKRPYVATVTGWEDEKAS